MISTSFIILFASQLRVLYLHVQLSLQAECSCFSMHVPLAIIWKWLLMQCCFGHIVTSHGSLVISHRHYYCFPAYQRGSLLPICCTACISMSINTVCCWPLHRCEHVSHGGVTTPMSAGENQFVCTNPRPMHALQLLSCGVTIAGPMLQQIYSEMFSLCCHVTFSGDLRHRR